MDLGSPLPGELLSIPKVTADLLSVARSNTFGDMGFFREILRSCGSLAPDVVIEDLRRAGCFISQSDGMRLSTRGYRTLLFAAGALGTSSNEVFNELRSVEPSLHRYELVREGMTSRFIKGLLNEPGFQRLYICSPWINLQKDDLGRLAVAIDKAQEALNREPEILVIAQNPKIPELARALESLRKLGAEVVEKPRLHSKLYMREPGPSGGLSLAIVGSENLTRQKWIELGIEIRNDSQLLSKLRAYFFQVFGRHEGE